MTSGRDLPERMRADVNGCHRRRRRSRPSCRKHCRNGAARDLNPAQPCGYRRCRSAFLTQRLTQIADPRDLESESRGHAPSGIDCRDAPGSPAAVMSATSGSRVRLPGGRRGHSPFGLRPRPVVCGGVTVDDVLGLCRRVPIAVAWPERQLFARRQRESASLARLPVRVARPASPHGVRDRAAGSRSRWAHV